MNEETNSMDFGQLNEMIGYLLRRAQVAAYHDYANGMGSDVNGVSPATFAVLTLIDLNPGLNQSTLAVALDIERSGVVLMINKLEAKGLAERRQSAEDKRMHALYLTPKGKDILTKVHIKVCEHNSRLVKKITSEEYASLKVILRKLYE